MTIGELIEKLKLIKAHNGDIEVRWEGSVHTYPPNLFVVKYGSEDILILNS